MTISSVSSGLGQTLVSAGLLSEEDWSRVQSEHSKGEEPLISILTRLNLVTETQLKTALETKYGVPFFSLSKYKPDLTVLEVLPEKYLKQFRAIPVVKQGQTLVLAMLDPHDKAVLSALKESAPGWQIKPMVCLEDDLLRFHGPVEPTLDSEPAPPEVRPADTDNGQNAAEVQSTNVADNVPAASTPEPFQDGGEEDNVVIGQDASLMLLANELISKAIEIRCSDMHVEPDDSHVVLRYLKNKQLLLESQLPKPVHAELVFCYKVIAGLNIAETSKPQDKRATIKVSGNEVQFRVTTIPGEFGETVAISFKFD